ncbi:MAG: hypothetical protein WCP39_02550 [Chlamydiota bacterium]
MSSVYFSAALNFIKENQKETIAALGLMAGIEIICKTEILSIAGKGLNYLEKRVTHAVLPIGSKIESMKMRRRIQSLLQMVIQKSGPQQTDATNELLTLAERPDISPYCFGEMAEALQEVLKEPNLNTPTLTRATNAILTLAERANIPSETIKNLAEALQEVLKEPNLNPPTLTRATNAILTLAERRNISSNQSLFLLAPLALVLKRPNLDLHTRTRAANAILTLAKRPDIPIICTFEREKALQEVLKEPNLDLPTRTRAANVIIILSKKGDEMLLDALALVSKEPILDLPTQTRATNAILTLAERPYSFFYQVVEVLAALAKVLKEPNLDLPTRTRAANAILTLAERKDFPFYGCGELLAALALVLKRPNLDPPTQTRVTKIILRLIERAEGSGYSYQIKEMALLLAEVLKEPNLYPQLQTRARNAMLTLAERFDEDNNPSVAISILLQALKEIPEEVWNLQVCFPPDLDVWVANTMKKWEKEDGDEIIKPQLKNWIQYVILMCTYSMQTEHPLFPIPVLNAIFDYHHPSERFVLLVDISKIFHNKNLFLIYEKLTENLKNPINFLPAIVFTQLIDQEPSLQKEYEDLFKQIPQNWHDSALEMPPFLESLQALFKENHLSTQETYALVKHILDPLTNTQLTKKERFGHMRTRSFYVLTLLKNEFYSELKNVQNVPIEEIFLRLFQHAFNLDAYSNVEPKYENTFATFRQPHGIFSYRGKLLTLSEPALMSCFYQCVGSVLEGTFQKERYDLVKNPHLKNLFQDRPQLLEKWKKGISQPLMNPMEAGSSSRPFEFLDFLKQKILGDKHLDPNLYPFLASFLVEESKRKEILQSLLEEMKKTHKEPEKTRLEMQIICMELSEKPLSQSSLEPLRNLQQLAQGTEFQNDILLPIQSLIGGVKKISGSEVVITDHFEDLFLCGTEVMGSCQRIDGTPDLNKCLLAYLMDGKNQLLAIKNQKKSIEARAIIRILMDEQKKEPALYMESIYGSPHMEMTSALENMAKQRAADLGLRLYSAIGTGSETTLKSFGTVVPYEYVDAHRLGKTNGIYSFTAKELL